MGGHRFFTKIEEVNKFWTEILAQNFRKTPRLSRIYYKNKFFNYPLTPANALFGVGLAKTLLIISSFIYSKLRPYKDEDTFEQWVSNRFGKRLFLIFFKTYTEKVWGIPCSNIDAEWAAQRIKGLSLKTAIFNAFVKNKNNDIKTLIDEFNYPMYGPGMMYTEIKNKIENMGGNIKLESKIIKVKHENYIVKSIKYIDKSGISHEETGTQFISSIPITDLIQSLEPPPEDEIISAANNLKYRSFIIILVIVDRKSVFPDNWIYIHSPEVKLGRIQNFKNWSKELVPNENMTSLGLEYFCDENDDFWNLPDYELFKVASSELVKLAICKREEIIDYSLVRVPKAYPVYANGYKESLNILRQYLKQFNNLHLVGRYGLFKYNNMDHSILTGFYAAKNIIKHKNIHDVWSINTENEYHEEMK